MKKTQTYRLASFETGDFLIPEEERRRFLTLDYHFSTYIGILGNGVISGWNIDVVSGLLIQISSGSGFIEGFYSESPYALNPLTLEPLRKSEAEGLGYPISEEIPGWSSDTGSWTGSFFKEGGSSDEEAMVFSQLGPDGEDKNYDGLVDGILAPVFEVPDESHFSDPYVKSFASIDNQIVLDDDCDNYIFAERINTEDPNKTFVKFTSSQLSTTKPSNVLLAKVTTRNGQVFKIDVSDSFRLSGDTSVFAQIGAELINNHIHGGSNTNDPPKINLYTEMRDCFPQGKGTDGTTVYTITSDKETEETNGHRHKISIVNGNGHTISVIGDSEFHYHRIENFQVVETVFNYGSINVVPHSHVVPEENTNLTQGGAYKVYVNNKELSPSNYTINESTQTITFEPGKVNITYPVYSSSFQIRPFGTETKPRTYSYDLETPSVLNFLIKMFTDFDSKYREEIEGYGVNYQTAEYSVREWDSEHQQYQSIQVEKTFVAPSAYYLRSPFLFNVLDDGTRVERDEQGNLHAQDYVPITEDLSPDNIVSSSRETVGIEGGGRLEIDYGAGSLGFNDFKSMSLMAASVLKKQGDEFILLPTVAKFIPMQLKKEGHADKVVIEILNDVEVSGVLKQDNIYFVRAEKFISGDFSPARIPFLNHIGRIKESFNPKTVNTITKDGVEFFPSSFKTETTMGHAHRIYIDKKGNGVTLATLVNDKITVFTSVDGKTVRIDHSHSIENWKVSESTSFGVNLMSGVDSATKHSHAVDEILHGSAKSIFAIAEDETGNIIMSTNDGILVKPVSFAILTSVGNENYYSYDLNVREALSTAISRYSNDTGLFPILNDTLLSQVDVATTVLTSIGSSYSFGNITLSQIQENSFYSVQGNDITKTLISNQNNSTTVSVSMRIDEYAKIDNLYSERVKYESEVGSNEIKIRIIARTSELEIGDEGSQEPMFLVREYFDNVGIWDVKVDGSKIYLISHSLIIKGSQKTGWIKMTMPDGHGIIRNISKDLPKQLNTNSSSSNTELDTQTWIMAGSSFAAFSRNNVSYSPISELIGVNFFDSLSIGDGYFILSSSSGIYKVNKDGSYVKTLSVVNCRWLSLDYGDDCGVFCSTSDGSVYKSSDDGTTWNLIFTDSSSAESTVKYGKTFVVFGQILTASEYGLINRTSSDTIVLKQIIHCVTWSKDYDTAYFGGDGYVYKTTDGIIFTPVAVFTGTPTPRFYKNGVRNLFCYAHNYNGGVCFIEPPLVEDMITASLDFDKWIAANGSWSSGSKREIFIDGEKVLSNNHSIIDKRGGSCEYFSEYPQSGIIDFSTTTSIKLASAKGDKIIYVEKHVSFSSPRSIVIYGQPKIFIVALSATNGTTILENPISRALKIDEKVRVLSLMTDANSVQGSFFTSDLENVGEKTHQELEDAFSTESVGLPMRLGETYLGNLSSLAVAAKHAIPQVDSKLINWKTYDMEYSCNPEDENYVGNDFDIEATLAASKSLFGNDSGQSMSQVIRCIQFGYEDFDGIMFVGTDTGLFYSFISPNMEQSWIKAGLCPVTDVSGIIIIDGHTLIVGGVGGIYMSNPGGLDIWTKLAEFSGSNDYPTFLKFRWDGKVGTYWWNSWLEYQNTKANKLTNVIVTGGLNFMLLSQDNGQTWSNVTLDTSTNQYNVNSFESLSDGTALLGVNGDSNGKTSVLFDTGIGENWNEVFSFPGVNGIVTSCFVEAHGNISITLDCKDGSEFTFKDHSLIGLPVNLNDSQRIVADNRDNKIFIQGIQKIPIGTRIAIAPISINTIEETSNHHILLGTNRGLLTDNGSYISTEKTGGIINELNKKAIITAVDINGEINSLKTIGANTNMICSLARSVRHNGLSGKKIILTNQVSPSIQILYPTPGLALNTTTIDVVVSTLLFEPGSGGYVKTTLDSREPIYSIAKIIRLSGVTVGSHVLSVVLTHLDKSEYVNASASKTLSFTTSSSNSTPYINVTTPYSGQVIGGSSFDIIGQVLNFDANGVDGFLQYSLDSSSPEKVIMRSGGNFSIAIVGIGNGSHSTRLSLVSISGAETETYVDIPFSIQLTNDPYIRLIYPSSGETISTNTLQLQYSVSNFTVPDMGFVQVLVDGIITANSVNPTTITLSNLEGGTHEITITLVDNSLTPIVSSYGSFSSTIFVQASSASIPRIIILSPVEDTNYIDGTAFVNLEYQISNFSIPSDGGVIVKSSTSEVFIDNVSSYVFPTSGNGKYTVELILAKSALDELSNPEAKTSVSFSVGADNTVRSFIMEIPPETSTVKENNLIKQNVLNGVPKGVAEETIPGEFTIIANGASTTGGETLLVVSSTLDNDLVGKTFRIIGENSTLYFSSDYPILASEFDGGKLYIDYEERNNSGKSYNIISNTSFSINIDTIIDSEISDGQVVRLISKDGVNEAWVTFDRFWGKNALCGAMIEVQSNDNQISYGEILSNTSRTCKIYGLENTSVPFGTSFKIISSVFDDVPAFSLTNTTVNLNHFHSTALLNKLTFGKISSITLRSSSKVWVVVSESFGLDDPLILENSTILKDGKIIFYSEKGNRVYEETIDLVFSTGILINISDPSHWNLNGQNSSGIDSTYRWEIDVKGYGKTVGTTYSDVIVYSTKLEQNITVGKKIVWVSNVNPFLTGDTVELFDSSGSVQKTRVVSVSNFIEIQNPAEKTFSTVFGASIRILRDTFDGDHQHSIKSGEVYSTLVEKYKLAGYAFSHNHVLSSMISDVSCINDSGNGKIYVGGDSKQILSSYDYGETWQEEVNLGAEGECTTATCIETNTNGHVFIGTGCGFIVSQTNSTNKEASPLFMPVVEESSSSSSESSELSSSSDSSSSLSSSSISSESSSFEKGIGFISIENGFIVK